jgi:hypothetical protein
MELGSINIHEDLKLLVKNLAYMIGDGTCECEERRADGGATKHTSFVRLI